MSPTGHNDTIPCGIRQHGKRLDRLDAMPQCQLRNSSNCARTLITETTFGLA